MEIWTARFEEHDETRIGTRDRFRNTMTLRDESGRPVDLGWLASRHVGEKAWRAEVAAITRALEWRP